MLTTYIPLGQSRHPSPWRIFSPIHSNPCSLASFPSHYCRCTVLPNVGLHPCRQRANQIVIIVGFAGFHWSNIIQDARHLLLTLYLPTQTPHPYPYLPLHFRPPTCAFLSFTPPLPPSKPPRYRHHFKPSDVIHVCFLLATLTPFIELLRPWRSSRPVPSKLRRKVPDDSDGGALTRAGLSEAEGFRKYAELGE
jgi:hypothetical protein